MRVFALCVFLFFLAPYQCTDCPVGCKCFAATNTVTCVSRELRAVPPGIPGRARTLVITGNDIPQIGPDSFPGLDNVTNICLSNNRITEVGSHTFSPMTGLRSLDLSRNPLALIHPEALWVPGGPLRDLNLSRSLHNTTSLADLAVALRWGGLAGLQGLDLSGNRLTLLAPGTFSHLPGLRRLLLRDNALASVRGGTFSGPEKRLLLLDLSRNAFRTFRAEALEEFGRLGPAARLALGHNPYLCSCEIRRFAAWLNRSGTGTGAAAVVVDADQVRCAAPTRLRDADVRAVRCGGEEDEGVDEDEDEDGKQEGEDQEEEDVSLQTSYVFLGLVLGFVGMMFLLVLYLNRGGMKKWITEMRDACRDVLDGYHYRYEIDSDPRLGHLSAGAGRGHFGSAPPAPPRCVVAQMPTDTLVPLGDQDHVPPPGDHVPPPQGTKRDVSAHLQWAESRVRGTRTSRSRR
ncbi:Trophoblast glycoprotein [Merluccius polli]|uniref:Trophoblast glycoprotein n=1 Tax=Merluccius polli TaxID=89951 RepID=A0AA47NXB0_MERPO|nr:Trophoblast glycoprotein [Merluccius polli]